MIETPTKATVNGVPGQGRPPERRLRVLFLGAGASKAAGLPLTEELLEMVFPRSGSSGWHSVRSATRWRRQLSEALKVLYPAGDSQGFRPTASDFFTALEVVAAVHADRARLPLDAPSLLADLRTEIARGLHGAIAKLTLENTLHGSWFASDDHPQVVITSNWDSLVEQAAASAGREVRYLWPVDAARRRRYTLRRGTVVILKLHGSIDWGTDARRNVSATPIKRYYADLRTPIGASTKFRRGNKRSDLVLRFKSIEGVKDRDGMAVGFDPPLMATMAVGKYDHIGALHDVWDDAYWCLSRASALDIIGYSFPADDLELRTLLRVTTRQAGKAGLAKALDLGVSNPAPEAHERARGFLGGPIRSEYTGAEGWRPHGRKPAG